MRLLTIPSLLVLAAATVYSQGETPSTVQQPTPAQREAREELNRAAAAYRAGNFVEAQRHSEKALTLDPTNRTAPIFVARTIHVQYKPGDDSSENVEIARAAIASYQRILSYEPLNEEAYKAIAVLYSSIREEQLLRDWILQRASDPVVPVEKRAEAYAVLAGKDWDCSFKITELPESKLVGDDRNTRTIVYRKPQSESDFQKAKECVTHGLEMAANAIAFDPECETGWSYKTNLLIESAKLAEMDGQYDAKKAYLKAANDAQAQTNIFAEKRRRREEAGDESESQSFAGLGERDYRGPQPARAPVDGGDLDKVAIRKPMPPYPPAARSAGVTGAVRVAVVVDETGRVISAVAVDGPMLLQGAAVAAARQAKFSPTYHDGQLVKVGGFLTYEFQAR